MAEDPEVGGVDVAQGVVAAVSVPTTPALTIHDIATGSPLELASKSSEALTKLLAGVPEHAMAVTVAAQDQDGGSLGVAVAARVGDGWSVGAAFQHSKAHGNELGFQLLKQF